MHKHEEDTLEQEIWSFIFHAHLGITDILKWFLFVLIYPPDQFEIPITLSHKWNGYCFCCWTKWQFITATVQCFKVYAVESFNFFRFIFWAHLQILMKINIYEPVPHIQSKHFFQKFFIFPILPFYYSMNQKLLICFMYHYYTWKLYFMAFTLC